MTDNVLDHIHPVQTIYVTTQPPGTATPGSVNLGSPKLEKLSILQNDCQIAIARPVKGLSSNQFIEFIYCVIIYTQ